MTSGLNGAKHPNGLRDFFFMLAASPPNLRRGVSIRTLRAIWIMVGSTRCFYFILKTAVEPAIGRQTSYRIEVPTAPQLILR